MISVYIGIRVFVSCVSNPLPTFSSDIHTVVNLNKLKICLVLNTALLCISIITSGNSLRLNEWDILCS